MLRALSTSRRVSRRLPPCTRLSSSAASPPELNSVTTDDVAHFSKFLPPTSIISSHSPTPAAPDELEQFNVDWIGRFRGQSNTVLKPKTTEEVSQILKWCNERSIGVCPQGGNTGLVGGSVPVKDEVVLSLANMNKIRSFDPVSGILVADAGCILQSLTDYVAPHHHIMPIDLGAKGSCQIGGNVATNAGGLRLLRYGSLHGTVLGLEVVLPDGTILDQLTTLRKDNTGYDLKQLFIGAEGTLGVITGVSILTPPAPQASNNVILALPSFKNVLPLYQIVKRQLSEILSAFEFIDRTAYDLAVKHGQGRALTEEEIEGAECFVLVETSGGRREHDEEKLNDLLETLLTAEEPLINTGVMAQNPAQFISLWALREGVTEAVSKEGKAYKYDISIPLSTFQDVVDNTREHLSKKGLLHDKAVKAVLGYGHVGDGNLHLNIVADAFLPEIQDALEPYIYEVVQSLRGSISAEHGIGAMKTHALPYSKSQIFQDNNGQAVKFFIQKDLPQEVQAELCETITSLGGRVETKVPRAGFILVQPATPEEERLKACWLTGERPDRFFVPYSYVEACKSAGMLLRQIFVENNQPIPMFIHPSIANPNARATLNLRIMHSGGNPHASAQSARVILADPNTDVFQNLVKTYQGDPNKYIESYLWVKKCIDKSVVTFTPLVYKNPGGRRPGEERTQFTDDDEERLCQWIADKIPYKETGGRTGNRLYQQLCDQAGDPEYAWVNRHTWQSWRERYKKNATRLDAMIAGIVEQKRPAHGEKGQYGYVRQPEEKPKRTRKKRKADQLDDGFVHAVELGIPGMPPMPPNPQMLPPHMGMHQVPNGYSVLQGEALPPNSQPAHPVTYAPMVMPPTSQQQQPPPPLPPQIAEHRKSPAREEDEEPEWAVKVGNAPPPAWARSNGDATEQNSQKRQKVDGSETEEAAAPEQGPRAGSDPTIDAQALVALASIHVIDHTLSEIAREFRFTVDEVKEFYDKCGEMERTRNRFQEMRHYLQEKFGTM
ncbi:hypothetical protein MD484_g1394, partial [Candolleomyces efflorescens]